MFSRLLLGSFLAALCYGCATNPPVKSAQEYFKEGEEFYASHNYEDAIAQWKKVKESYFSLELSTLAELKIADAYFDNESYIEAAAAYADFRKLHPDHEKAAYALYRQGLCYYDQITGVDTDQTAVKNAINTFQDFLTQYPKAEYATEVREKLAQARIKQVSHEIYVGRFYLNTEHYAAAIKRLNETLTRFPSSPVNDETLFLLGKAYMLSGERQKGRDAFNRISAEYPGSKYIEEAKKIMEEYY